MRLGIAHKLFSAILVTNVVMAAVFGVAMHVSVNRGFRDYVEERNTRRLQELAQILAAEYAGHGNWEWLRNHDARWQALIRPAPLDVDGDGLIGPRQGHDARPPGPGRPEAEGPRRPEGAPFDPAQGHLSPPPPPGAGPGSMHPPRPPPPGPVSVELVDAQRNRVGGSIGAPHEKTLTRAVVAGGTTVGWLSLQEPPFAGTDSRFLDQLLHTSWAVAGIALLLAAAAAIPLARGLLAPIRRLAQATHRLAAGDYTQTIAATTTDELGQLILDFDRLATTLKDAETARRGFLAEVSHELRTPLAVLRAELDALQDGVRTCTPAAIHSLQAEVAMLSRLVDDLYDLAVADLGAQSYRKEGVDVARLVGDTVAAFDERFAAQGLTVDSGGVASAPAVVHGDARRLTQLLNNLFENTLRYTDPGGRVEIVLRTDPSEVILDVMDSAPGVPAHLLPRLFERLFRVEPSRSREFGGAGLGLALCRSIVRAHGGTIEAKASPLGGLWIQVRLSRAISGGAP